MPDVPASLIDRGAPLRAGELNEYLDDYLRIAEFKDYPGAWNGAQIEGARPVLRIAAAVDASIATTEQAVSRDVDLLLVHHGLYWDPDRRLIDRAYRRIAPLIKAGIGVYSCHLPLDAHPDVGNNAVLIRKLGLIPEAQFGDHQGSLIGWIANTEIPRNDLVDRLADVLGGPARSAFLFGPDICCRVGVITGGAGAMIQEARDAGVDTFITGEGAHHTFFDASELEMNVLYAGHYATETLGVRALAAHLEEQFGINWEFIHLPTEL